MPDIQFIRKKIGLSYLIWLEKGNKYLLLEEPAWFVFNKIAKKQKEKTIVDACCSRYGISDQEGLTFVQDINSAIEQMNQPSTIPSTGVEYPIEITNYSYQPYSTHRYLFGNSPIEFSYESDLFESYLHPLICHLATEEIKENLPHFELFAYDEKIIFRLNGEIKGAWGYDETHLVKGLIFMHLVNVMFDKTDDFWLMTVHASAITNGKKSILFSAGPGSGKTTMAAMLQNKGFRMVSDDFVPIDRHSFHAWPFPIAMSVKEGSMDLLTPIYPDLVEKPINQISTEKSVRYIFPDDQTEAVYESFPVKEYVFIKYDPTVEFEWKKLDLTKAAALLLDQSWVSPINETANILLDQLSQWSFYELTYSNNQKALDTITNLFGHD